MTLAFSRVRLSGVSSDKGWVEGSIHPSCFASAVWSTSKPRAAGYSTAQAIAVGRISGWELQRELLSRYGKRVARWFAR
jgi:hypothetical protein